MIAAFEPKYPRLLLSLATLADEFDERPLNFEYKPDDTPRYRGFSIYRPGDKLESELIYCLDADTEPYFPCDRVPYLTVGSHQGRAPHIRLQGEALITLCSELNRIFRRYHDFEAELNAIVQNGGDLDELCRQGSAFFENPMYIHDNLFTILAQPCLVDGMLVPDVNEQTGKRYIPLWLIEDFKFNKGYTDTLRQQTAQVWGTDQYPYHLRTLYVNIWDGNYYRARLLINELHTAFKPGQYRLAEYFAEFVRLILRRDEHGSDIHHRSLEDTVKSMLSGCEVNGSDLRVLLTALGWREDDLYLCIKCQSQDSGLLLSDNNALRAELADAIRDIFTFFEGQQLYLIINLTASGRISSEIRSLIAPFLRDGYMYAGASVPITSIYAVRDAFREADLALETAFRQRGPRWYISFEDCAVSYMLEQGRGTLPTELLVCPALNRLKKIDREKGTEYYKTLRCYIRLERNIPQVSAALIIHRTTLLYRLEKIRELVNINTDDEEQRLYLLMSFRMLDEAEANKKPISAG